MADNQFLALLEQNRPKVEALIPPYFDKELWFNNAKALWNVAQRDEKLRACTPQSLYNCVEEAARRGLEMCGPNKHCAPVAFKTTAVLITQWQGKAFIWMKSGAIKKLLVNVVYEGDKFEIYQGDEDRIVHSPNLTDDRPAAWQNNIKNIVGAYAIATLWSGERVHSFVNRAYMVRLMEWVKKKNQGSLGFGYQDWLPEMFCKTAVHRLDGKIQPPPHMDPEQIAAWQRASQVQSVEAEFEHVELPPDIMPTAAVEVVNESKPSGPALKLTPDKPVAAGKATPNAEPVPPATIKGTEHVDALIKIWKDTPSGAADKHKVKNLSAWLETNFGVDDLEDLPVDKVIECGEAMDNG